MRALYALLMVLSLLASCTPSTPASPQAFAERFIQAENKAWSTGDLSDLKALEADDVVYHIPGMHISGWAAHESYIQQGRAVVSDLKQTWKYLSGEGNHFVLSYESTAVVRPDPTQPPVSMANNFLCAFRTRDGKIAEVWMNGSSTTTPVAQESKK